MKNSLFRVTRFDNPWIVLDKMVKCFRRVAPTFKAKYLKILHLTVVRSPAKAFFRIENIVVHTRVNERVQNYERSF